MFIEGLEKVPGPSRRIIKGLWRVEDVFWKGFWVEGR